MAKPKQKYYVVWRGRTPGIYNDWQTCEQQIKGFEQARYKSFSTMQQAQSAFLRPADEFIGIVSRTSSTTSSPSVTDFSAIRCPSLCVDAACSGNPGMMEYRGVYLLDIHQNGEREEQEPYLYSRIISE